MATLPPNVQIRRARFEDKSAVMAMNEDAFFGIDNMDHYFDRYVSHPNYMAYVLLENNIVVGFQYAYITDDFQTKTRGGQRTLPSARHNMYQAMLDNYVTLEVKKSHGKTLRRNIYIANHTAYHKNKVTSEPDMAIICIRNLVSFKYNMASLQKVMSSRESPKQIRTISYAEFDVTVDRLLSPETKPVLFPQNFFILWEAYAPLKTNFQLCRDICTMRITSIDHKITSLSLCHVVRTKSGLRMDLENYGGNLETLRSHVIAALLDMTQKRPDYVGQVFFNVMFPRKWGVCDELERFVKELGFVSGEWSQSGGNEYCILEYDRTKKQSKL